MLNSGVPASVFLVALGIVYLWRFYSRADSRFPPGPRGLPLLGNILQVPGKTVILLGDMKIAKELLEKRSAKYSSRPVIPYFRKHVDPETDIWIFADEGEHHSRGRKLTTAIMSLVRAGKTEPLQEYEATLNIQHLLDDRGKDWFHHMKR
ncbi:hypothetical protein C0989_000498 [Termitomyces sp. Mn162]|nr:hypothetical protein C0989_000498 [Termitomyces sp. Mn162]